METIFTPITTESALEHVFAQSSKTPMIVFKHDPFCPISAAAHQQMEQIARPVVLVDVAHNDNLAQEIAARTGIEHESPQVILLWHNQAAWSASHYDITQEAVNEALREVSGGETSQAESMRELGGDDALMGRGLGDDTAAGGSTGT